MNSAKPIALAALSLAAMLSFSACRGSGNDVQAAAIAEASMRETVETADPQGAADAIVETLDEGVFEEISGDELEAFFGIDYRDVDDYAGYYSDAKDKLRVIVFINPAANRRDDIYACLSDYRAQRVLEYTDYDLFDSLDIAENGVIFDQGEYLVLLMLPDNDAARDIIDDHLPL